MSISLDITFDEETKYYSGIIIEYGICLQAKSLDELKTNFEDAMLLYSKDNNIKKQNQKSHFSHFVLQTI